jgi:hypothetical protein
VGASGTVQWTVDGTPQGSPVTPDAAGTVTLVLPDLPAGAHVVGAAFGGTDDVFAPSSGEVTDHVLIPTSTSLTVADASVAAGRPVVVTATVEGGAAGTHLTAATAPTGSVAFFVDGASTPAATETLDSNGQATFRTSALPVGRHHVTATYAGTGDYAASSGGPVTVTITAAAPSSGGSSATGSSTAPTGGGAGAGSTSAGGAGSAGAAANTGTANTGAPVRDLLLLGALLAGGGGGILVTGRHRRPRGAHRA